MYPYQSEWQKKLIMTDADCDELCSIVKEHCGIKLGKSKRVMIQGRLDKRLNKLQIDNYQEYLIFLKSNQNEFVLFINSLTTNKTEFWREKAHYEFLKNILNDKYISKSYSSPLYLWSAASSTGEEAYSIAMLLEEHRMANPSLCYKILGTDIDTSVLSKAKAGIYPQREISGFPPQYIPKYFSREKEVKEGTYKIKDFIKNNIKFRQHNLIEPSSSFPIKFDVIFLRNVLIYFEPKDIQIVINKLVRHLKHDGYLILGHSESLNGIKHNLKLLNNSIYQKI